MTTSSLRDNSWRDIDTAHVFPKLKYPNTNSTKAVNSSLCLWRNTNQSLAVIKKHQQVAALNISQHLESHHCMTKLLQSAVLLRRTHRFTSMYHYSEKNRFGFSPYVSPVPVIELTWYYLFNQILNNYRSLTVVVEIADPVLVGSVSVGRWGNWPFGQKILNHC